MTHPRSNRRPISGVLLIDKPYGISSNRALQQVRSIMSAAKAGHTGVLDPLATGLLPVCFGEATKFSSYLLEADKGYSATVKFGVVTTTGDSEGAVVSRRIVDFDVSRLLAVLEAFHGEVSQVPPMYSALKYQGKPLYEYARVGIDIQRHARPIHIRTINLITFDSDTMVIDVLCSKGTYIRTLASDIGEILGCGAHLTGLRRTSTGGFLLDQACQLHDIAGLEMSQRQEMLLPTDVLVRHFSSVQLQTDDVSIFTQGQPVRFVSRCDTIQRFRIYREGTCEFLGLGEARGDGRLHPIRLLSSK